MIRNKDINKNPVFDCRHEEDTMFVNSTLGSEGDEACRESERGQLLSSMEQSYIRNTNTNEDKSLISVQDNDDNWERKKQKQLHFSDDGTESYFWRAHTLTVLGILIVILVYIALFEISQEDSEYNAKRGMLACVGVFILLGVTVTPDGPFLRPHPAIWRLMFVLSIVYHLSLIFILFQSAKDARLLLKYIDVELGEPMSEQSYGLNCRIYDSDRPDNPFHNIWDKMDLFVPTHFFGWWLKTLVVRDWWLCTVISIMFEVLEYTLEHQLPNFSECWWDHWILDALLCNGIGIWLGLQTLKYFRVRTYYWRGLWNIPGYRGKLQRIIAQFGPHSWIDFDWRLTSSFGRWMSVLAITFFFLLAELNTFYLKFVMWVPPGHWINLVRVFAILLWGAVAFRETFQYLDDNASYGKKSKKFGRQSWLVLAIVVTEFLIVAKFGKTTLTKPIPSHIAMFWYFGSLLLVAWTVWNFGLHRHSGFGGLKTYKYKKKK